MADPTNYSIVRLDDNIGDNAVITYDAAKDMLVDSGLIAKHGELEAAAGTVSVGLQEMSSAGEQVVWRNENTQVNYAPPWHIIDEVSPGGSVDRFYGNMQTVPRFTIDSDILINPEFDVKVPTDEIVFTISLKVVEAHNDVVFMVTQNGYEMWRQILNLSAGKQDVHFEMPIAFHTGDFHFKVYALDGTDVKIMGNAQTNEMAYSVRFRPFTEKPLATQDFVLGKGQITTNYMQKSVYDSNNDGIVDKAQNVNGVDAAATDSYYGTDSKGAIGFHKLPESVDLSKIQNDIKANNAEINKHEISINNHGRQIATNTGTLARHDSLIQQNTSTANLALNSVTTARNNMVSGITVVPNSQAKTLTIRLISKSGTVDTEVVDLSSWFSDVPPSISHIIYKGFNVAGSLDAATIISDGTQQSIGKIDGLHVDVTRQDAESSYIWVWIPDAAGTIRGFSFSGFISVWVSTQVTVNGTSGRLYISPNKTTSKAVTFEVITR